MSDKLSHLDDAGHARMVDVGGKITTDRRAVAEAVVRVPAHVMSALNAGDTPKGNVYEVARLAGIMAAKRTDELIPLCHSLPLSHAAIEFTLNADRIRVTAAAATHAATGVEMEALTAACVAALTLYDMLKALSHEMVIEGVRLLKKSGGKSGEYTAETKNP